jgi:hypothetical protein
MATDVTKFSENVIDNQSGKKDKKSRWRDIEKVRDNIRLLKALKEINADYKPYTSSSYMEF